MAKKYYVVWKGRRPGIYNSWAECEAETKGFKGAKFKGFNSLIDAEEAFKKSFRQSVKKHKAQKQKNIKNSGAGDPVNTKVKSTKLQEVTQDQIDIHKFQIKIFCDGSAVPNPGEAAAGIAIYSDNELHELQFGLYEELGTNNTAELNAFNSAMHQAISFHKKGKSVAIYCDSQYVLNCMQQWCGSWKERGWKKADGNDVMNIVLIKPMYQTYIEFIKDKIPLYWVRGHSGIQGNELADRMSVWGRRQCEEELGIFFFESAQEVLTLIESDR